MEAKRWTLGVVLAAAVSLFGLVQADASPFSTYILSDDLGNSVSGTAPEASNWEVEAGSQDGTDEGSSSRDDTSGSSSGTDSGSANASETGNDASGGVENDGHGNNVDGVDSSNRGQGKGGPNGADDASCPEGGECVDDEMARGSGRNK